jgi:hypothetical protein
MANQVSIELNGGSLEAPRGQERRNAHHAGSCSPCFACSREVQNVAGDDSGRIAYLSPEPFGLAKDKPSGALEGSMRE